MKKGIKLGVLLFLMITTTFSGLKVYALKSDKSKIETNLKESQSEYPDIYNYLGSMTYSQFKNKVNNREDFYVYVGRPSCGDCNEFEPKFIELISKYQLGDNVVYLNVSELREDENAWELYKETYGMHYTPTLAKFSEGKLDKSVEWTPETGISISDVENFILTNLN